MKRHVSFAAFALAGVLLASACSSSKGPVAVNRRKHVARELLAN